MSNPVLVATAHGTDNPQGRAVISSIVSQVAEQLKDVDVIETYVDVQYPQVDEVLEDLSPEDTAVVVPLLLSTGYHTKHDITKAVRARHSVGLPTVGTPTLGPHPALAQIQVDRILAADAEPDLVILTAAGSSDSAAQEDVAAQAELLRAELAQRVSTGTPEVLVAYLSASAPNLAELLAAVQAGKQHKRIVVSSYLLAQGFFQNKIMRIVEAAGLNDLSVRVTEPLGDDSRIAQIVVDRFTSALA